MVDSGDKGRLFDMIILSEMFLLLFFFLFNFVCVFFSSNESDFFSLLIGAKKKVRERSINTYHKLMERLASRLIDRCVKIRRCIIDLERFFNVYFFSLSHKDNVATA